MRQLIAALEMLALVVGVGSFAALLIKAANSYHHHSCDNCRRILRRLYEP